MDRAALDAALKHGVDCGGWCPAGRLDEWGIIPARYPVRELQHGGFAERTLHNVRDANGTVIIYFRQLRGGTKQTVQFCREQECPHQLIDGVKVPAKGAAEIIAKFVRDEKIVTLNVAGPRESEVPHGYNYAFRALDIFLSALVSAHD